MEETAVFYAKDIFLELKLRRLAENSFYSFLQQAWSEIESATQFQGGWYLEALCEHLEAVYRGDIKDLIINVPPRTTKTITVSCMFPAWVWLHAPYTRFLCLANDEALAMESALKHRDVITSEWYKSRWGEKFELREDQNSKSIFGNDCHGYRISRSILARTTGKGANIIIIDDPNNTMETNSDRLAVNQRWNTVLSTRLNDLKTDKRIIVQQRSHEQDLTGHILSTEQGWTKFILPMEFEKARRCKTIILPSSDGKPWTDPREKEGELLCPSRFGPKELKRLKSSLGNEYNIAGQLQQRPAPQEGGLFKKAYFKWWDKEKPPSLDLIIQSWDCAITDNKFNSYSACTTWGVFKDDFGINNIILLNLWRDKVQYPLLRKLAKDFYLDYRNNGDSTITPNGKFVPDYVLIEGKATGDPLIQDLRKAGIPTQRFDPSQLGDKMRRAQLVLHIVEAGRVWVPARPPNYQYLRSFANTLVDLCAQFPNAESNDVVDTMTQMLHVVTKTNLVRHPSDKEKKSRKKQIVHYGDAE